MQTVILVGASILNRNDPDSERQLSAIKEVNAYLTCVKDEMDVGILANLYFSKYI